MNRTTIARRAGVLTAGAALATLSFTGIANAADTLEIGTATAKANHNVDVSVTYTCETGKDVNLVVFVSKRVSDGGDGPTAMPDDIRGESRRILVHCDSEKHTRTVDVESNRKDRDEGRFLSSGDKVKVQVFLTIVRHQESDKQPTGDAAAEEKTVTLR